jgi:hypothetical protein
MIVFWFVLMILGFLCALGTIIYNLLSAIWCKTNEGFTLIPQTRDNAGTPHTSFIEQYAFFNNVYTAQISLDLTVIIGLSVTVVGIALQRGAADYSVIVSVIVLFTTIGLVSYITNVLHMIHLQAQGIQAEQAQKYVNANAAEQKAMRSLIFNRVLIAILIDVLLFIFLYFAGLDSAQPDFNTASPVRFASKHLFGSQQYYIFSIVAFVILVFGDLSLELRGFFFQTMYANSDHYMYQSFLDE